MGWCVCGLSQAQRYHLELNWTALFTLFTLGHDVSDRHRSPVPFNFTFYCHHWLLLLCSVIILLWNWIDVHISSSSCMMTAPLTTLCNSIPVSVSIIRFWGHSIMEKISWNLSFIQWKLEFKPCTVLHRRNIQIKREKKSIVYWYMW